MTLLLIEDEISKERNILKFISEEVPMANVVVKKSITSGIMELRKREFDYLLLDMSLPLYDYDDVGYSEDNEFETFGGTCILDELDRKGIGSKVIVVTAFDILGEGHDQIALAQIEHNLREDYPQNFIGAVFYNTSSVEWKNNLKVLLRNRNE